MPKVVDSARITTPDRAVWRTCTRCGTLAALDPDESRCPPCRRPARPHTRRAPLGQRDLIGVLSAPAVIATRDVYARSASDLLRVAALVEIAAAAAALARTVVKLHHIDPDLVTPYVRDVTDLRAVLGRGRWLPTMTRHVPVPPCGPVPIGAVLPVAARRSRRALGAGQTPLFDQDAPVPFVIVEGR